MAKLPPVPHQTPLIDVFTGLVKPVWSDWFKHAFVRMGGHGASTNDELDAKFPVATANIADAAVTADKIAAAVAGNGLAGGAGSALSVTVDDSTIEINTDALRVKDAGITFAKLLSTDWTSSKGAGGYQKLASGLYIQWGITTSTNSAAAATVTFPTAFPTACLQVIAGIRDNSGGSTTATGHWGTGNYSASGCSIYNRTSAAATFNWMAIGH